MLKIRSLMVLLLLYFGSDIGISQADTTYCPTDHTIIEPFE